jgi:hypothetical protein
MLLEAGNGGWLRVLDAQGVRGSLYLRLLPNDLNVWSTREVYFPSDAPITLALLRRLPLREVELEINAEPEFLQTRLALPPPDLQRLATFFGSSFGARADHWVAQSFRAQVRGSGVGQAPAAHQSPQVAAAVRPPLSKPEHLDDVFFAQLKRAYIDVVTSKDVDGHRVNPAPTLAKEAGVAPATVRRWIYEARKRGSLPKGKQGRAGV